MKIVVGLSGGVDSSVAAAFLKEQGHDVIGVTMKLWNGKYKGGNKDACFSPHEDQDIEAAQKLAEKLGIEHHVIDCSEEYDNTIIRYFKNSYANGKTPNPCVRCNAEFKFGLLPLLAEKKIGKFDKFATGHYARIDFHDDHYHLKMAKCKEKDQSYFLSRLSQEQLAKAMFPLGEMESKADVREIARKYGLDAADKPDSMDFYSGDINELVGKPDEVGNIIDMNGNVLGKHNGYWHYTIGQRKGLGISSTEPLYVIDIKPCHNLVVVGTKDQACSTKIKISNINWFIHVDENLYKTDRCRVKIRSNGKFVEGYLWVYDVDGLFDETIILDEHAFGVTPGQLAVLYNDNDEVMCSGYID